MRLFPVTTIAGRFSKSEIQTMIGFLVLTLVSATTYFVPVDQEESKKIEAVLEKQATHWNDHDIEGFMETYWKSEDLTFSSGGKTRRGWQTTLDNYKKGYPGDKMGKLHFDGLEIDLLSDEAALVLGFWHLDIKGEKKDGNFSLVLKKFDGDWKIIHDHSSTDEPDEDAEAVEEDGKMDTSEKEKQ